MTRLLIRNGLLARSFEIARSCGGGRAECVMYWTGPSNEGACVDALVHPAHTKTAAGYEVDPRWITSFFGRLRRDGRTTRLQLHTHPALTGHSTIDDDFPLIPAAGFLSLVVPRFATGPASLDGAYLAELQTDGTWIEMDPEAVLEWEA